MGKERFSAFDVCAEVSCLRRSILGLWCVQIYDGVEKNSLLLKFNKPASSEERTGGSSGGEDGRRGCRGEAHEDRIADALHGAVHTDGRSGLAHTSQGLAPGSTVV